MDNRNEPQRWVRPSRDVVARRLEDEMVLVHLQTNRIFRLNRTGARFWELLLAGQNKQTIEQQLLGEFDVDAGRVSAEIDALLRRLEAAGLIEGGF